MHVPSFFRRDGLRHQLPVFASLVVIVVLLVLPTGYEDLLQYRGAERCLALVLDTDNSTIVDSGLIRSGEQRCTLNILDGRFRGSIVQGVNMLNGSLELDKIFVPGDRAMAVVSHADGAIRSVSLIDHYRLDKELLLFACFAAFLILFAGRTGLRALLSFALTVLMIWKVLVPCYLDGWNPVLTGLGVTLTLTIVIISLVYGFDGRAAAAISGSFLGIAVTCLLGMLFTDLFHIHGAIMSGSESLLYSGYPHLNLTGIFMASIFIGSSGAVMDLAVDITSAVREVTEKRPDLTWIEAARSGMNVGRAAMGTMTTTLLLAYSGGYVTLLMVFMAQGTPITNILSYKYVAAEIADTMVGSFGLVSVAPFTALSAGILLGKKRRRRALSFLRQRRSTPEVRICTQEGDRA